MDYDKIMERVACGTKIVRKSEIFSQMLSFLEDNGIINVSDIQKIKNGRNSQVYLIEQGDNKWILKKYHQQNHDLRNRLENEFVFLSLLKEKEMIEVAHPISKDSDNNLALLSYMPGLSPKSNNFGNEGP